MRIGRDSARFIAARPPGVRVVVDVRPLQEPEQAPVTAAYLGRLLEAYAADPLPGESFVVVQRADLPAPGPVVDALPVAGRRIVPPTRFLRAGAQTVDPFIVRGASVGTSRGLRSAGAAGRVYHAVGAVLPLASSAPVVATMLDLAPWDLPGVFQRSTAARFGARLRTQLLREATLVVCGTRAVADHVARRLHVPSAHLRVVPLAARDDFTGEPADAWPPSPEPPSPEPPSPEAPASDAPASGVRSRETEADGGEATDDRRRLGLGARYLVYAARHDARHDLPTLLEALAVLAARPRPESLRTGDEWPPRVLIVEASPDDRAAIARAATRHGVGEQLAYAPTIPGHRLARVVRGARGVVVPAVSDAAGLAAIEALA